jgi:hypothetical protein
VTKLPILIGSVKLRRLSGVPEGGIAMVPGCLTSESEERETWTAESLRAALLRGSCCEGSLPSMEDFQWKVAGRDFGGLTFQVDTVFVQAACGARARMKKLSDLVKRCDQPGKVLIQT